MKKSRIPISAPQGALQSPFASLEIAGLPEAPVAEPAAPKPVRLGRVVLRREKSGRGGKTVVVVSGFADAVSDETIEQLARQARQYCGCGGTVAGREIELQGDSAPKVRAFFETQGFSVAGV